MASKTALLLRRLRFGQCLHLSSSPVVAQGSRLAFVSNRLLPTPSRSLSSSLTLFTTDKVSEEDPEDVEEAVDLDDVDTEVVSSSSGNDWLANFNSDPKDRTREIPLELSLAYLLSDGYKKTYGGKRVRYFASYLGVKKIFYDPLIAQWIILPTYFLRISSKK